MNKKIIFIHHYPLISGAEKVLVSIISGLQKDEIEPILVCPKGELSDQMESYGVKTYNIAIPVLRKTWNPVMFLFFIFSFVQVSISLFMITRKEHAKIIYANSFIACLFSVTMVRLSRKKLVWHMHDLIQKAPLNRVFVSLAGYVSDTVIATTKFMKQNLASLGVDPDIIEVIPNGIDLGYFDRNRIKQNNFRKHLGISSDIPLVGIVGQLTPWKGHRDFLYAAAKVVEKNKYVKFIIVGDSRQNDGNSYRGDLEQLVSNLGIFKNVIFIGFHNDVRKIMSSLNILVNCSCAEPFGMTIIEAMALGVPVIATDSGGVPEIINDGKNGILYPPGDCRCLAQNILEILNNLQMAEKISNNALKTVSNKFSLSMQNSKISKIL